MLKKLILLGFGLTLLIGLPLALFVLQNQSQTTSQTGATPATVFSFTGPTSVTQGQNFDEVINVDPGGTNQVSFIKFAFTYNSSVLGQAQPLTIDTTKYTILENPTPSCSGNTCTVTATISVGSNQNAIITSKTPVATFHFVANTTTDTNGTQLAFVSGQNQALSVASSDQAAENVFQTGNPTTIVVTGPSSGSGGSSSPTPTAAPSNQTSGSGTNGSGTSGNGNGSSGTSSNLSVTCTSLTADSSSGNAPLTVTFTTVGTSSNDSISQLVLDYGDGSSDTVASGSGIGTGDINNQLSHTYSSNGSYTAHATLTTTGGATSDTNACNQTVTVGAVAQATPTPIAAAPSSAPSKLPPTGPGETVLLIGAAGALLAGFGFAIAAGL